MNFNLDEKGSIIYQFLYDITSNNCFKIDNLKKAIEIEDIKIPYENENHDMILEDFLKGSFKLANFRENLNYTSVFVKYSDIYSFNTHITPYLKAKKINNLNDRNNTDSLFSYVLSNLVLKEKTNGILIPIVNFDVKFEEIEEVIRPHKIYDIYKKLINDEVITDKFSIGIRENFFKMKNLKKYFKDNKCDEIKQILFQLFHTLYVIMDEYPDFRHNNLILENILIQEDQIEKDKKFKFKNNIFTLKNNNLTIKISFFGNATCKNISGIESNKNKYYDINTFLNDLQNYIPFKKLDSETINFLKKIHRNKEISTLENILNDDYFREFENIDIKKISNDSYMSKKLNNFMIDNLESDTKIVFGDQQKLLRKERKKSKKSSKIQSRKLKGKERSFKITRKDVNEPEKYVRKLKLEQQGGEFRKTEYPYKKERNNPYTTNDAKETFGKFKKEEPTKSFEPKVLAEQKIYDTQTQAKPKMQDFVPNQIPAYNPFSGHYYPQQPWETIPNNKVHVVKPVNITFSNPVNGNHHALNRVYEDMLPGDNFVFSLKSVYERKQLTNFIRGILLEKGDGEELSITAGNKKSLLSFIKLIEINPYNVERNPYKSLSKGFLLYSSAYPIRYNSEVSNIGIAKDSVGVNIRIYELSLGAITCNRIGEDITSDNFDVWREIKYYEYVREDILKKKVSPNFVGMYLYTTDSTSRINYDQLDKIRLNGKPSDYAIKELENIKRINNKHELDPLQYLAFNSYGLKYKVVNDGTPTITNYEPSTKKMENIANYLVTKNFIIGNRPNFKWTQDGIKFITSKNYFKFISNNVNRPTVGSKVEDDEIRTLAMIIGKHDLTLSSNKSLVALTEAPNSNILSWASPTSENFGTVQKMRETGYHTPEVWRTILFQMVYTFAVLQNKEIYFKKLSLENNFFIKDLYSNNEKRDHWIYKVNGIDFYIPNYGYLLMFDSRYVDLFDHDVKTIGEKTNDSSEFKINSTKLYNNTNDLNEEQIKEEIYYSFKIVIGNFSNSLSKFGGIKPDGEVVSLLENIYSNDEKDISKYLLEHFKMFLHNRNGTRLTNDEMQIISNIPNNIFKKGELVVYRKNNTTFEWAIYIEENENRKHIIVCNEDNFEVFYNDLKKIPSSETIKQNYKGILLDSENTIEVYNFNN